MSVFMGLFLGLATLIFVGPVMFYLIKSSINDGKNAGYSAALGILAGDIIYVILVLLGLGEFFAQPDIKWWMFLTSAVVLLLMGLINLTQQKESIKSKEIGKNLTLFKHFANGFIINFVNPFVLGVWIYFYDINASRYSETEVIISLCITLIVIFLMDCVKAFYAEKLNKVLTPQKIISINKIVGLLFILFSIRFFYLCF